MSIQIFGIIASTQEASYTIPLTVSIAASIFCGLVCGLVLLYLRTISQQLTSQDSKIKTVASDLKVAEKESARRAEKCKDHCYQNFVGKVDYIREITRQNKTMDDTVKLLSEVSGNVKAMTAIIENMPKICGNIASQIVREMKKEDQANG